jgi:hypothetical protein
LSAAVVIHHRWCLLLPSSSAATIFHYHSHHCHSTVSSVACHRPPFPVEVCHPILCAFIVLCHNLRPSPLLSAAAVFVRQICLPPLQLSLQLCRPCLGAVSFAVTIAITNIVATAVTIAITIL